MKPGLTRAQILDVIGDDVVAYCRGETRRSGPSPEEKLATAYGGTADDYRHMAPTAMLYAGMSLANAAQDERNQQILAEARQLVPRLRRRRARYAPAPSVEELRERIAALKAADERQATAWERQERAAEQRREAADHEAAHVTVGLDVGAEIATVEIDDGGGGRTVFAHLPPAWNLEVTVAGTIHERRGLAADCGQSDYADVEREIDARCPADISTSDRANVRATLLHNADRLVQGVLTERWEFKRALVDRLIEAGRVSGAEAHELWHSIYPNE